MPPAEVPHRVAALAKEVRDLKKQLAAAPASGGVIGRIAAGRCQRSRRRQVVVAEAPGADADAMRQLIDQLRKTASPVAVLLGSAATTAK